MNCMALEYTSKNCHYYWSLKLSEHTHIFDFFFSFRRRFIMEEIKRGTYHFHTGITTVANWFHSSIAGAAKWTFPRGLFLWRSEEYFVTPLQGLFDHPFCSEWRVLESGKCPFNMELSTHPLPFFFLSFLNDSSLIISCKYMADTMGVKALVVLTWRTSIDRVHRRWRELTFWHYLWLVLKLHSSTSKLLSISLFIPILKIKLKHWVFVKNETSLKWTLFQVIHSGFGSFECDRGCYYQQESIETVLVYNAVHNYHPFCPDFHNVLIN